MSETCHSERLEKRALSEAAQFAFEHLAQQSELHSAGQSKRPGLTLLELKPRLERLFDEEQVGSALDELYGHQLVTFHGDLHYLTSKGRTCLGYAFLRPCDKANELVVAEDGIHGEIGEETLTRLLAERAPKSWSNALLIQDDQVVAVVWELPRADARSHALNWHSRGLPGRIVVIDRTYTTVDGYGLDVYEFDRLSGEWLPLIGVGERVALAPRTRLSELGA